jgi:predicted DNA-binding protein
MAREQNMKQTSLFLRLEQFDKLAELSRVTGAPVAELIRRAIDAYLEQRQEELGSAGKKDSRKR